MSAIHLSVHHVKAVSVECHSIIAETGTHVFEIVLRTTNGEVGVRVFGADGKMPEMLFDEGVTDALPFWPEAAINAAAPLCTKCGHKLAGELDWIDCPECGEITPADAADLIAKD